MRDKNLMALIAILLIKAFVVFLIIVSSPTGLSPDEAQYWTWSGALDFGYYSKPPGIAWEIFLGTSLFKNNELGVRFFSLIIGFLLPLAVYFLSVAAKLRKTTAFWCGIMMAFSPIGFAASFFATTDGSMVLFWTLASVVFVQGLAENKTPNFLLLGAVIALGALFKWPIYLFWLFPFVVKRFWNGSLVAGFFVSLLGLLPSLFWNYKNDFATFRHVFSTVKGESSSQNLNQGNFFEFLGAQVALVSPILFALLVFSVIYFFKNRKAISKELQFCFFSSFGILTIFMINALFKKMQGNWAVFAYPAAFVFMGYVMIEKKEYGKKWIKIGVVLSIILTAIAILIPVLQDRGIAISYRLNPFRHNVGWNQLPNALEKSGYDSTKDFLFADKYQTVSILSFYNKEQKRAYFFNLQKIRKNQFSYWTSMQEAEIGKTGYFVVVENSPHLERNSEKIISDYQKSLSPYFEKIEYLGTKPLFNVDGKAVKSAFIFKGINYNGKLPEETILY